MNISVKPLVTNVVLGKQPCYSKLFWWSFTGIKDILGKWTSLPFPTSPIRYKQTEWRVIAIDKWQHPEPSTANNAVLHKTNTAAVSCSLPVLLFLMLFQEHKRELSYYRQSTIKSRINYRLEALVKLRLAASFIYFLNLHPSTVCQNFSPRANYWLICGQESNFETILLQLSNFSLCSSSKCWHCSPLFSYFRPNILLHPLSDSIHTALARVTGNVQHAF